MFRSCLTGIYRPYSVRTRLCAVPPPADDGAATWRVLPPILVKQYMLLMKTTIDIADPILREARRLANREGTTLRALVEQGLRHVISERKRKQPFRLNLITVSGQGLRPELRDASWERIRDLAYERDDD